MDNRKLQLGDELDPYQKSDETLELLRRRRSTPADLMTGPGPDAEQLALLLQVAARVPDHRRVVPYRFIIFEGEARARFGVKLRERFVANEPNADERRIAAEQNRFMRAPVVVAVISNVDKSHRTPEWEQVLSVGAVCQNLLIAASAAGFAAQWLTEWYAFDDEIASEMDLSGDEKIAGFVYIGAAKENPKERARPDMATITEYY